MDQVIISRFAETSPCHGCAERTPFCHKTDQCKLHTSWRARKEAFERADQEKRRGRQTAKDQLSEQFYKQFKKDHMPGRSKGWR